MDNITLQSLHHKKKIADPIVALTCYDAWTARLIDAHVDVALVGDSLANTRLGYPNTLPVTVEEMLHHVKAAARGIARAMLVADMPFQSYEWAPWEAAKTAGRFVKEGRAHAVKVEGGRRIGKSIEAILKTNIPVMGHVGLTPQSLHAQSGYRVQAKKPKEAKQLIEEAKYLEKLGVFALVIEGVPAAVGKQVTKALRIPTIGIGAGPYCDGQILVLDDVLGLGESPSPKFVKAYAPLRTLAQKALEHYHKDVIQRRFPDKDHSY